MRLLTFIRSAVVLFVYVENCFGSITRRDERTDQINRGHALESASTTDIIPTKALGPDKALYSDNFSLHVKTKEARGIGILNILEDAFHTVVPTSKSVRREWLKTCVERIDHALSEQSKWGESAMVGSRGEKVNLLSHDEWISMENEMDTWINERTRPDIVFLKWGLLQEFQHGIDVLTVSRNPKLLLWLNYVNEYKNLNNADPSHEAFGDKELLPFLVDQIERLKSLALPFSFQESLPYLHLQLVKLFDFYRQAQILEKLAMDMLVRMILIPTYRPIVLKVWLEEKESPNAIFSLFRLGDKHGPVDYDVNALFIIWLNYIELYWNSGASEFSYGSFNRLRKSKVSGSRLKNMFESNALEQALGARTNHGFGSHAANLRTMWQVLQWKDANLSPEYVFRSLNLLGKKFKPGDFNFMKLLMFIDLYQKTKSFSYDEVLNLLRPTNFLDEVLALFKWYLQFSKSSDFISGMLEYLSPDASWERFFPRGVQFALTKELHDWFQSSVTFLMRVEEKNLKDATLDVIYKLDEKLSAKKMSSIEKAHIFNEIRKEPSVVSALKSLQGTLQSASSRKRKTSSP